MHQPALLLYGVQTLTKYHQQLERLQLRIYFPNQSPSEYHSIKSKMPMPLPVLMSRTRERPGGDEEASSTLTLGEFSNVPSLSLSEARILIKAVLDNRRATRRKIDETEILVKTQDYLDVFARFKQKENIEAVERLLISRAEFESFERSQLGQFQCSGLFPSEKETQTDGST